MRMPHAAVFADGQALAGSLQFLEAHVVTLAGLKAFRSSFVRRRHGPVALDVGLKVLFRMRAGRTACEKQCQGRKCEGQRGFQI